MTAHTAASGDRCLIRVNERVYPALVVSVEPYGGRWVEIAEARQFFSADEFQRKFVGEQPT